MQTILGAGGVIGRELAARLPEYTDRVRLVSRTPARVNADDDLHAADLLDPTETLNALEGSEVAYLVAGLRYSARIWEDEWPRVMRNVMDACRHHRTRLVFLDNVYAYGNVDGPMTEDTPYNPCSRKGEVRARIATTLMKAAAAGELDAMIVRAADFYGPGADLAITDAVVIKRVKAGRTPQWIGDPDAVHTFSYTPDVAHSLAVLGNDPEAWGQVWHALTHPEPMTGRRFAALACELAGHPVRLRTTPGWLLRVMEWVVSVLRENREMMYQFNEDYVFDSSKLAQIHELEATEYREGIGAALEQNS